jgi:putative Mn2+ efflux pump MntP
MDSYSGSVRGLASRKRLCFWPFLSMAFFFGLFQGGMPLIGWLAGSAFNE